MSTMKFKRPADSDAAADGRQPPPEVVDRLAGLLPVGAFDDVSGV